MKKVQLEIRIRELENLIHGLRDSVIHFPESAVSFQKGLDQAERIYERLCQEYREKWIDNG